MFGSSFKRSFIGIAGVVGKVVQWLRLLSSFVHSFLQLCADSLDPCNRALSKLAKDEDCRRQHRWVGFMLLAAIFWSYLWPEWGARSALYRRLCLLVHYLCFDAAFIFFHPFFFSLWCLIILSINFCTRREERHTAPALANVKSVCIIGVAPMHSLCWMLLVRANFEIDDS